QKLCRIARITLDAVARILVKAVELRGVPPGGVFILRRFGRPAQIFLTGISESRRLRLYADQTFVDSILPPAAELLHPLRRQYFLNAGFYLSFTAHRNEFWAIASLFKMGKPVMGHELHPKR